MRGNRRGNRRGDGRTSNGPGGALGPGEALAPPTIMYEVGGGYLKHALMHGAFIWGASGYAWRGGWVVGVSCFRGQTMLSYINSDFL